MALEYERGSPYNLIQRTLHWVASTSLVCTWIIWHCFVVTIKMGLAASAKDYVDLMTNRHGSLWS